ncbi:MAG: hypothetical protein ACI865_000905 [Flavobacteriaceae bacterium]|jgi:hypothetical protein
MIRDHQIEFCERCKNKAFSPKSGIICALTNEQAKFSGTCKDFVEDAKLTERVELSKKAKAETALIERTYGLSSLGVKNGVSAGIIWITIGFVSTGVVIYLFQVISFWTVLIIVFGIVITAISAKASAAENVKKKRRSVGHDLLDDV